MRTYEDILADYLATKEGDELIEKSHHIYGYRNEEKRDELRKEYIQTLPRNKQLAIELHNKLCRGNHTDGCSFYYEIKDLDDNWEGSAHKKYLKKADLLLKEFPDDIEKVLRVIDIIESI